MCFGVSINCHPNGKSMSFRSERSVWGVLWCFREPSDVHDAWFWNSWKIFFLKFFGALRKCCHFLHKSFFTDNDSVKNKSFCRIHIHGNHKSPWWKCSPDVLEDNLLFWDGWIWTLVSYTDSQSEKITSGTRRPIFQGYLPLCRKPRDFKSY